MLAFGLIALMPTTQASAHAYLTDSNPADGSVLDSSPKVLRLQFSESVVIAATRIEVVNGDGQRFQPAALRLVGGGRGTEEPVQVVADLPPLPKSAYRISWQTLSSDDLHKTSGVLVFGINAPVTAAPFHEPTPPAEEVALRWLLFAALATLLGGQLGARLYRSRSALPGVENSARRCLRLAALGGVVGLVTAVGLLVDQLAGSGSSLGRLFSSSYGSRWVLREVGLALLVGAALVALRGGRVRRLTPALVVVGGAAACLGSALLGHASSGRGILTTRLVANALHLAAAATWSGLLIVALVVVLPRLRIALDTEGNPVGHAIAARAVLRAFALPAALCVSVIAVTGLYLASTVVGSVDAALLTLYGRALIIKVTIAGIAGLLGLINLIRLRAPTPRRTHWRTVAAESVLATLILGLAAVLTSGQPAREPRFVSPPRIAADSVVDTAVADLQESATIQPNRPGANVVLVDVFDTRRPAPAPIRRVLVNFAEVDGRIGTAVAAERLTDGHWSVAVTLEAAGRTTLRIVVERPGLPDATHNYKWTVGGGPVNTRRATVSTRPIGPLLSDLALGLGIVLVVAWGVVAGWLNLRRPPGAHRPVRPSTRPDRSSGTSPPIAPEQPEPVPPNQELVGAG